MIKFLIYLFLHLFVMALTMYFIIELRCWQMNVAAMFIVLFSSLAFGALTDERPSRFMFKSGRCRFCGAPKKGVTR